jgi:hypothetical protein
VKSEAKNPSAKALLFTFIKEVKRNGEKNQHLGILLTPFAIGFLVVCYHV